MAELYSGAWIVENYIPISLLAISNFFGIIDSAVINFFASISDYFFLIRIICSGITGSFINILRLLINAAECITFVLCITNKKSFLNLINKKKIHPYYFHLRICG